MKKQRYVLLAVLLCIVQITLAFSVMPVAAEGESKTYNLSRTLEVITVDGKADEEIWKEAPSSETFAWAAESTLEGFTASFQAVWAPCIEDATKMNVYILVKASGYAVENSYRNYIRIQIENENGTHRFWSGMQQLNLVNTGGPDRTATIGTTPVSFQLKSVNNIRNSASATFEFCYQMPKTDTIKFDVLAVACTSDAKEAKYAWGGMTGTPTASKDLNGVGTLLSDVEANGDVDLMVDGQLIASLKKDTDGNVTLPNIAVTDYLLGWKDSEGELYGVGSTYHVEGTEKVTLEVVSSNFDVLIGASVLIEEPTALRFDVTAGIGGLKGVKEMGAVFVKTNALTASVLEDKTFTAAELTEAGIDFEQVVLISAEEANLFYAVKENISDVSVRYSVCAYMTLEYTDGATKTLTTQYQGDGHSRNVREIAVKAYAERSSFRGEVEGMNYMFKVGEEYAVGDFELFSFSPYTKEQLDVLAAMKK